MSWETGQKRVPIVAISGKPGAPRGKNAHQPEVDTGTLPQSRVSQPPDPAGLAADSRIAHAFAMRKEYDCGKKAAALYKFRGRHQPCMC
jgi:hypothetical protein